MKSSGVIWDLRLCGLPFVHECVRLGCRHLPTATRPSERSSAGDAMIQCEANYCLPLTWPELSGLDLMYLFSAYIPAQE